MKIQYWSAITLLALVISGCGGESSSGNDNGNVQSSNLNQPNKQLPSKLATSKDGSVHQIPINQPDIESTNSKLIFAVEGLIEKGSQVNQYTSISFDDTLPAFTDSDSQKVDITISVPTIIIDNGSSLVDDWHCYQTTNLTAQRKNHHLMVDGMISEYRFDMNTNSCSNDHLSSFVFNNAVIDSTLAFENVGSVVLRDENNHESNLPTYEFIALAYGQQMREKFGESWELVQRSSINSVAKGAGVPIFKLDKTTGNISLDLSQVNTDMLIDFASLDQTQLLLGSLWGMPGQGIADEKWCHIVNIPEGLTRENIKYQTVISTNCARSTPRYCDSHGSSFSGGNFAAVSPVAWDDITANNAQLNSNEQYRQNKQGHFIVKSSGQNAFVLATKTAIVPVFGYTIPRVDGHINNAGRNSWAGHEGHCQNVMNANFTKVGIGYKASKSDLSKMSYWTQDFN
ncbi:CAP domain-containing protein [Vibrio mediterranei]